MIKINQNANGHISKLIKNLNNNLENLKYAKIKILEPSEDENVYLSDLNDYNNLKLDIEECLLEVLYINTEIFMGKLTEYVALKFEEYYRIINLK